LVSPVISQVPELLAGLLATQVEPASVEYSKFVSEPNGEMLTVTFPASGITEETVGIRGFVEKLTICCVENVGVPLLSYSVTM
jgi:hypothetical protein